MITEHHSSEPGVNRLDDDCRNAFGLTIGESLIHGKGCFAAVAYHAHQQIAEYVGDRISLAEAERRRRAFGDTVYL